MLNQKLMVSITVILIKHVAIKGILSVQLKGSTLLESRILPHTAYQKQQETLIVWSEGDRRDLALSFQEKAGCDEIWEKICEVSLLLKKNKTIK
jgi:hypothetical protein